MKTATHLALLVPRSIDAPRAMHMASMCQYLQSRYAHHGTQGVQKSQLQTPPWEGKKLKEDHFLKNKKVKPLIWLILGKTQVLSCCFFYPGFTLAKATLNIKAQISSCIHHQKNLKMPSN